MVEMAISFSEQARVLLKQMPSVKEEEIIKWKQKQGIEIGGGDIVSYLRENGNGNTS